MAGIVGAFAFKDKTDDRQEILELATKIEGHPDNVAPAIFGALTVFGHGRRTSTYIKCSCKT